MERFIADVHLGKLARYLRMLGFDTVYKNSFSLNELISIVQKEDRILLSRNAAFADNDAITSFAIRHEKPFMQLKMVVDHFRLQEKIHPFSRCIVCNGLIEYVSKERIIDSLEQNTIASFNEFWQCQLCSRIYWKGSHYEQMQKLIAIIGT